MSEQKIVTLLASATEIVCALGFENSIVARSHGCDYPPSILKLPVCTETRVDTQKSSSEIDKQIKTIIGKGLSVYQVNSKFLKHLQPDVIVTQTQCEVCAVSPKDLDQALQEWMGNKPSLISLEPNSLKDVWTDIKNVASSLGAKDRGKLLVSQLLTKMEEINKKTSVLGLQPRVACIEWIDPLMAAGNWIPELVSMAGGKNVFGIAGQHSPWISWELLRDKDPEIILFLPCGYDMQKTRQNLSVLTKKSDWIDLSAVKNNQVFLADGSQYFNRPGPRLVESLEILSEILHPSSFSTKFEGSGWERL